MVKDDMEAAKLQLEAYSSTLTELISKIGTTPSHLRFVTASQSSD